MFSLVFAMVLVQCHAYRLPEKDVYNFDSGFLNVTEINQDEPSVIQSGVIDIDRGVLEDFYNFNSTEPYNFLTTFLDSENLSVTDSQVETTESASSETEQSFFEAATKAIGISDREESTLLESSTTQESPEEMSSEVATTESSTEQNSEELTTVSTSPDKREVSNKKSQENHLSNDFSKGASEDETSTALLSDKSIDSGGAKPQTIEVKWNGPTVKTQSVKTKANWTTTVLNGEAVYTDISVFLSHGSSYQFRIPGGLPEKMPGGIITWVRANNHKYPHKEISYTEFGTDVVEHDSPPTELPLRCGTKFLEKLSGGKSTPIEENPWQVAVLRRDTEMYVCGGAVITRRHVLSAAHCFKRKSLKYSPEHILLRVGDYDKEVREESQVDYVVAELIVHEHYQEKRHLHDIALLTTSGDIPFSSHVYPICLPTPWAKYTAGMECVVSGWGQGGIGEEPTRYLKSGQVAIVSHEECRKKTIFSKGVPPEIFCAEDPTKQGVDTCLGDSGGPFACSQNGTFYLFGITAFGSYPCGQDIPSFYTNVSFYKLWILHVISTRGNSSIASTTEKA